MTRTIPVRLGLPFVVALLTRANAVYWYRPELPEVWGGEMPAIANSIANGLGFASPYLADSGPSALLPPVYPYLLAGIFRIFGYSTAAAYVAMSINVVLSALVVIPLYVLTRNLFGPRPALLAAWLWALFALTGQTDALYVWNTSLLTLLLTAFMAHATAMDADSSHLSWGAIGALAGVLIVTDPTSLTILAVSAAWLIAALAAGRSLRPMASRIALVAVVASVLPAAWIARNYAVLDRFVFVRSGLGLELDVGVRDFELASAAPRSLPNRNPAELRRFLELGELRYVAERGEHASRWIRANPGEYAVRVAKRALSFWTGRYQMSDIYVAVGRSLTARSLVYSIPALAAFVAMVGMLRRGHRARWWVVAVLAVFPLVYYFTHTLPRYRMPIEPLLLGLTASVLLRRPGGDPASE